MDLLDTILRASNSEEYLNNFRTYGIDGFTLKILNEEDLEILGVSEGHKRKSILEHVKNLRIPSEKVVDRDIDEKYIKLVLHQISQQLHKHLANLSCAIIREDVVLCNVKLTPAVRCLEGCLTSLDNQIDEFKAKMLPKKKKSFVDKIDLKQAAAVLTVLSLSLFLIKYKLL